MSLRVPDRQERAPQDPPGAAFRLRGVSKHYGGKPAVREIDLDVPRGSCLVLIGPSGCGKSTVLRLLLGLVAADAGTLEFEGVPVVPATWRDLRLRIGTVIQEGGLLPHLTAERNATLKARDLGWDPDRIRARLDEVARLAHFPPELFGRLPAQLSGGQRQRVGLMRALMLDPEALLMDEPLGALDPMIRARLQDELKDIFRRLGKTVVFVTHDMSEAAYLGDSIVLMREGRIVQCGTPADLLERPAEPFVVEFVRAQRVLGTPA